MNKYLYRISTQDQVLFIKRLSVLVKAGIPILEALRMLEKQARTRTQAKILRVLVTDVENGQYLSTSLEKFRYIFGDLAVNIIRVGEVSGTLYENLNYLAEELKKKQELRKKVIGALIYPVFIVIATFGITGLLTVYVFPRILPIFESLKFSLPWTTRALIFLSGIFLHKWFYILFSIIAILIIGFLLLRVKKIRYGFHRTILTIPLFGRLSQSYQMANFCRTLGILLKSDVMIVEAASITAQTLINLVYKKELNQIAQNVTKGEKISTHLDKRGRLFPPLLTQMVAVGETTGNLSDSLLYLAELYESEVDDLTKNLTSVLEPILLVLMGVIVGFVAISIITPIYQITQNIHP